MPSLSSALGLGASAWPLVALAALLIAVAALAAGWLLGLSQGLSRSSPLSSLQSSPRSSIKGVAPAITPATSSEIVPSGPSGMNRPSTSGSGDIDLNLRLVAIVAGVAFVALTVYAWRQRRSARRAAVTHREALSAMRAVHEASILRLGRVQHELALARQALAEAEAAQRARSQLLAAASHDLLQPLNAMIMLTGALRSRRHDVDQARLVADLCAALAALDELLNATLDIASLDAGGVRVHPCDFSVEALWHRLRAQLLPEAFDKGLSLRCRGGRHVVHADPLLIERIVRNLVCNAIRCTTDGGVLMAARRRGSEVVLQVWDSGCGIAPADQARVFEEFVQVDPASSRAFPGARRGLGLGLAIVRRLAGLMQCRIELRSVQGRGTVFSLHLPVAGQIESRRSLGTPNASMANAAARPLATMELP